MAEEKKFVPFVSADTNLPEMTLKALILGLFMAVLLGAANAYLGLKAGMTIAATYPAAVIGMAVLRLTKGSILEENIARTVGSIGESVAAGAIFTIPAFMIAGIWDGAKFGEFRYYVETTVILFVGGVIGILFVSILRRVMVEDKELPFPESIAASEIHKAGRSGKSGAKFLFGAMGIGALIQVLIKFKFFADGWQYFFRFASKKISLSGNTSAMASGGGLFSTPGVSPAYMGVGYIIGPNLAALNFTGGLLAWGLFVPLLLYFLGPQILSQLSANGANVSDQTWAGAATDVWKTIVRPIAIGGMLMSAAYTLWKMRKSLITGLKRAIGDISKAASGGIVEDRTQKDMNFKWVFIGILLAGVATFFIYNYYAQNVAAALVATLVMIIAGFFFSAVSGYLVGLIGSSNNPISGLTISTLIVAALLMVALGMHGQQGIAAVLGVAAVVCVGAAVAGEMLQDLKVGHILGGTPWKMEVGDLFGILIATAVMFWPLWILHQGDIMEHGGHFIVGVTGLGGASYPAPQASLMAIISSGIVGGDMAWPLIIVGMLMAIGFILVKVKSPMLVCVGMYLPLETSFAIFIGGLIKGIYDKFAQRAKFNENQKARSENVGVLLAAGLIAGEALIGLLFAAFAILNWDIPHIFEHPSFLLSLLVFIAVGYILVRIPMKNAGNPDEPAPPMTM